MSENNLSIIPKQVTHEQYIGQESAVPHGWTQLVHGTDSLRWAPGLKIRHIVNRGLSVVDSEEVTRQRNSDRQAGLPAGAYDTTTSYSRGTNSDAEPIEVRIIAPSSVFGPRRVVPDELRDVSTKLTDGDRDLLKRYYPINERHPYVPRGENIIQIADGYDEASGRRVEQYIPDSFADLYIAALTEERGEAASSPVREAVDSGRQYIGKFNQQVQIQQNRIEHAKSRLERAQAKLESDTEGKLLGIRTATVIGAKRVLDDLRRESDLMRPSSQADEAYRMRVYQELPGYIADKLPKDSLLRFHATTLDATQNIIDSGEISSSVDRVGVPTSYDASDQVSVTTTENTYISVQSYMGATDRNCCLPIGCMFVVLPKDKREAEASGSLMMDNVYFRDNPDQLVGVLTSPENLPKVRAWLRGSGIDAAKAQEFFDGVELLSQGKY